MQQYNHAARVIREDNFGVLWREVITGGQDTIEVRKYSVMRVRATGATTVKIAGILAATMSNGEILRFNVGLGAANDNKKTVTVEIGGANAFVILISCIRR